MTFFFFTIEIAQQLHDGLSWNVVQHEIPGMNCNNTGDLSTFHLAQPCGQNVIVSYLQFHQPVGLCFVLIRKCQHANTQNEGNNYNKHYSC